MSISVLHRPLCRRTHTKCEVFIRRSYCFPRRNTEKRNGKDKTDTNSLVPSKRNSDLFHSFKSLSFQPFERRNCLNPASIAAASLIDRLTPNVFARLAYPLKNETAPDPSYAGSV